MRVKNLSLTCLVAALLAGCGGGSNDSDTTDANVNTEANNINLGILLAASGPTASLAPPMIMAAETAVAEVSTSGKLLDGTTVEPITGDSTCINSTEAVEALEQLIMDNVLGVVGTTCSGVQTAVLTNAAIPAGMVMISPSATSPALSELEDDGLFFRTSSSDARQGSVLSQIILERGIQTAAVTYTNNAYGSGLHDSFKAAFEASGGAITISATHEDGKVSYSEDAAALAAAGGDVLVVLGFYDQGGSAIIQESVSTNAFNTYALGDGMINDALPANIDGLNSSFGIKPGLGDSEGVNKFSEIATGFDPSSPFAAESYDAAALILLAMQAAESSDPNSYKAKVFEVANSPGEKIYPGELGKALDLLAAGSDIDYVGASNVELIEPGDSAGSYEEVEIQGDAFVTVAVRTGQL